MSNDFVVMDNSLINAAYKLRLNEQRLILCAIAQIPKGVPVEPDKAYCVTRDDFIRIGVHPDCVSRDIRTASKDLMKKTVRIATELGELEFQWLSEVLRFDKYAEEKLRAKYPSPEDHSKYLQMLRAYNLLDSFSLFKNEDDNVIVRLVFHKRIAPFLTELKDNFTGFKLEDLAGFSSTYSIRIYQLMMQFKSTGYRKIQIKELRRMLELGDKYEANKDFKKWVVDTAVDEINEKSPYTVTYEISKTGRKFTHLEFKFKQKENEKFIDHKQDAKNKKTPNIFHKMTESQLDTFASKLSVIYEVQAMANIGEDMKPFTARLRSMLKDPEKQMILKPYLEQVGFKVTKS